MNVFFPLLLGLLAVPCNAELCGKVTLTGSHTKQCESTASRCEVFVSFIKMKSAGIDGVANCEQ